MYLPPPLEFHKLSLGCWGRGGWRSFNMKRNQPLSFLEPRVGKDSSRVQVCMQFGDFICSNRLLLLPSAHSFRDLPTYAIWIFSFSFQVET